MTECRSSPCRCGRGFTLIEVVIAVSLVTLLLVIGAVTMGGWTKRGQLDEGARQFETMLRMAQADACIQGRRIRLVFDGEQGEAQTSGFRLEWEYDPTGHPGEFVAYEGDWGDMVPAGMVRVESCELVGQSAYKLMALESLSPSGGEAAGTLQTVVFEPDGTSDWARIVLVPVDAPDDDRRAVIVLRGDSGKIECELLEPESYEAFLEQLEAEADDPMLITSPVELSEDSL